MFALASCASKTSRDIASTDEAAADLELPETQAAATSQAATPAPVVKIPAALSPKPTDLTSVTVSFEQISRELGIPQARLKDQTQILSKYLVQKKLPKNFCEDADEKTEKICNVIDAFGQEELDLPNSRTHMAKVKFKEEMIPDLQAGDVPHARLALKAVATDETLRLVPAMLKVKSCPHNLSVVAMREIESELPSSDARSALEDLYDHASECLQPTDEAFEVTHLRQALLRHLWGKDSRAKDSIKLALTAQQSRERQRVLFWAGIILGPKKEGKPYWDLLVKNHPLSFHALEVWRAQSVDPYRMISQRPLQQLNREVIGNENLSEAMRWVEALYIKNQAPAAEVLTLWIGDHFRDSLLPSNMMYLSALKFQKGSTINMIRFLTSGIGLDGSLLNQQTLTMLFPKPYFDIFDKASPHTDVFLVLSIARQESGFDPMARSAANARGILQLLPATARTLSGHRKNDLYNPSINVSLGAKYVSQLIEKFNGSVELALAAYNAGPNRIPGWVDRYTHEDPILFMDLIPYRETRDYVANILRNNYWYHRIYGDGADSSKALDIVALKDKQKSDIVSRLVETHRGFPNDPGVTASSP